MRLRVDGGPADGAWVAAAGVFRWIAAERAVGFAAPAPGRALYWRTRGRWLFTGQECWRCGCGAVVVERADWCPLCGVERAREAVR